MTDLVPQISSVTPVDKKRVERYVGGSLAENTHRAYRSALSKFRSRGGEYPATGAVVASYLSQLADEGYSVATIEQHASALNWVHEASEIRNPMRTKIVLATMAGIRRTVGVKAQGKAPIRHADLMEMIEHCDLDTLRGRRDKALLLFAFASAMRRSEIEALTVADVSFEQKGMSVQINRSKTDQEGKGREVAIWNGSPTTCPCRALRNWLRAANITEGPIFRSLGHNDLLGKSMGGRSIAKTIKSYAKKAGLDPSTIGAHSMRAGFVTEAADRGATLHNIMEQTGHKSVEVVRGYIRHADRFENNPGKGML